MCSNFSLLCFVGLGDLDVEALPDLVTTEQYSGTFEGVIVTRTRNQVSAELQYLQSVHGLRDKASALLCERPALCST